MSDLDRLIADEKASAAAEEARSAASADGLATQTRQAYSIVESVLHDATQRRKPWTLIGEAERLRISWRRSLRPAPAVYGWVFPFSPGWGEYGMALTVGGRIVLMSYNEGNEKHAGSVGRLHDPYPPHSTWPSYGSLNNVDGLMRNGAERFERSVARAIARGETWHTPVPGPLIGSDSDSEFATDFICRLTPRLEFSGRKASEV